MKVLHVFLYKKWHICILIVQWSQCVNIWHCSTLLDISMVSTTKHHQAPPSTTTPSTTKPHYLSPTKPLFVNIIFCSRRFSDVVSFVFSHQWEDCPGVTLLRRQRNDGLQTREYSCLPPCVGMALAGHILQSNIIVLLGWCCLESEFFIDCQN